MRRKLLQFAFLMLLSLPAMAQSSFAHFQWSCMTGNTPAITAGLPSVTLLQVSYPQCQVTVYQTGTMTPAVLYSNISGASKGNPFTANTNGAFDFYVIVQNTPAVDVVMSGGLPAPGFPVPVTLSNIIFTAGGGGGGSPCGTINDVQTNAGGGNFGCDSGFLYNTASNHTLFQNIFSAMLKVLVSDVTHSGQAAFGASNGTSITNTYSQGVNSTLSATYGIAWPDSAPSAPGQVPIINSLTPVLGLLPTVWGTPNGAVSQEFMAPLFKTNAPSPTTTNDLVDTPLAVAVSLPYIGPPPSGYPLNNVGADCISSTPSVAALTCQMSYVPAQGSHVLVVGGTVEGIGSGDTTVVTADQSVTCTQLDHQSGASLGTSPSSSYDCAIPAGVTVPPTFTLTPGSPQSTFATIMQVIPVSSGTVDVHAQVGTANGSPLVCPSVTTANNPDLLVCVAFAYSNGQVFAPTTGYGLINQLDGPGSSGTTFDIASVGKNVTTPAAYTPNITVLNASNLQAFTVAYKVTSTSGPGLPSFRAYVPFDTPASISTGTDYGVADAYKVYFPGCYLSLLAEKTFLRFIPANANATTTPTLALCNLAATVIEKQSASGLVAVAASDMITTVEARLTYYGGVWVLENPVTGGNGNSTTVNGQACTLGGSCNVNNSAAQYSVAVNGAANAAIQGVAVGAGQTLQGASGSNPTATYALTLGVDNSHAGNLQAANGSSNAHTIFGSAATTSNTILGPATVIANGHLVTCTTSSTTCTLTDGGTAPTTVQTWGFVFPGVPTASAYALRGATATCTIPANFTTPTTTASCGTNPTSNTIFTLKDGATTLGTVTLSSACAATLATSGGATKSVTVDDRLQFIAPASPDATAADIIIQLRCQ